MKNKFLLNQDWKFRREEDIYYGIPSDFFDSYREDSKTGLMSGPKNCNFYDVDWQTVQLPHDWVIRCEPNEENKIGQGYRPKGAAWYRKHFTLDPKYDGKKVFLKIEAAAASAEIYINSIKVGVMYGGFTPVCIDVTDFIYFDKNNTIAIRTDVSVKEGWWYEGGGLYRNVYLIITESAHFADDGVFVSPKSNHDGTWTIEISAETIDAENCSVEACFKDVTVSVPAEPCTKLNLTAVEPLLWDASHPNLYDVRVTLMKNDEVIDEEIIKTGFREIHFDSETGFYINGRAEKIKGVALHQDHAGVGVAVDKSILMYRLKKLKELGCNAIRTAHNPHSPALCEVCDELGFYVMDEIRHFSSSEICLGELEAFVRRDRNHPSVILWSMFNEEPLQCTKTGEKIMESMLKVLRKHDPVRPITGGMNGPIELRGVVNYVDVMGFNYLQYGYDEFHKLYPNIPILGSENGSYMTHRDEFCTDQSSGHVACYTKELLENLYYWSDTPGGTWKYICQRPFVAGVFYWTGTDYYGESVPFSWPCVTNSFGTMDICCFPKDSYFWMKALWSSDYCMEITRPWAGKHGELLDIVCYSNCETIELILNGRTICEEQNDVFDPKVYQIPYEEGILCAVGKVAGKIVCQKEIRTYGNARILQVVADKNRASTVDSVIFDVYLRDEYGQLIKNDDIDVTICLSNGYLTGSANGDAASHRSVESHTQTLYHGCAQFIVKPESEGVLTATVTSEVGEVTCAVDVLTAETKCIGSVPFRSYANHQMMSDVETKYPTAEERLSDFYAWIPTTIGVEKNLMMSGKHGYATLRNDVSMPKEHIGRKKMVIEKISGNFDVYCKDTLIYMSDGFYSGDVEIDVTNVTDFHPILVVFKLSGEDCGVAGNIYIDFSVS